MGKKRVLIVDDDKTVLKVLSHALTREGYSVFTSEQSLGTSLKVAEIKPHLLVMDVVMPGLRGDKLCKILKDSYINKEMKIILYSGKDHDELKEIAMETKVEDFLSKSGNHRELLDKVNSLLKEPVG